MEPPYEDRWREDFSEGSLKAPEREKVNAIYQNFCDYAVWMYMNCGNGRKARDYENKKKSKFLKKAYQKLCKEWEQNMQSALSSDKDGSISQMGRTMGIDCQSKENFDFFEERMTLSVVRNLQVVVNRANWRIDKYRKKRRISLCVTLWD